MSIKETIQNSPCKYLFVAIVIMSIIMIVGTYSINTTMHAITEHNLEYTEFTVVDKYIGSDDQHHYIVVSDERYTYAIENTDEGMELYNSLNVGERYHFVIQLPTDNSDYIHIIRVYNETN